MTSRNQRQRPADTRPLISTGLLIGLLSGGLLLALAGWLVWSWVGPKTVKFSSQDVLEEVEKLGHLTVQRVRIAEVLTAEMGGDRALFKIHGDALIAVDLRAIEDTDIDEGNKTITFSLPDPHVMSPRVDHSKSELFDYKSSVWNRWIKGTVKDQNHVTNVAYAHAQEAIEAAANSDAHIQESRVTAVDVLNRMFRREGWRIKVKWPGNPES